MSMKPALEQKKEDPAGVAGPKNWQFKSPDLEMFCRLGILSEPPTRCCNCAGEQR